MTVYDPLRAPLRFGIVNDMRPLLLVAGLAAAATLLVGLGSVTLIWSQSETSYYIQFGLACLLLYGLFVLGRGTCGARVLGSAALASASITTAMPMESFAAHVASTGNLKALGIAWLLQIALTVTFVLGIRYGSRSVPWLPKANARRL